MKLIVYFILINVLICSRLRNFNNTDNNEECKLECFKLSRIFNCFCDSDCIYNQDCCKIYMKNCNNYFKKDNENEEGSCCSNNPKDCFCDSKCVDNGDCCKDYNRCKMRMSFIMKSTLTPQISIRYLNKSKNNQTMEDNNLE